MTNDVKIAAEECFKKLCPHLCSKEELEYYLQPGKSKTITDFIAGAEWNEKQLDVMRERYQNLSTDHGLSELRIEELEAKIKELEEYNIRGSEHKLIED